MSRENKKISFALFVKSEALQYSFVQIKIRKAGHLFGHVGLMWTLLYALSK
jgi:hypothetical protein